MKRSAFLACAAATLALAGCNKKNEQGGAPAADAGVKITTAKPPPGGNWSDVVNETAAGFMMGDPNAKVKLVEIGALTCPHCRAFDEEGVPTLIEKYVKTGQVSWEFRPYLLHGLDLPTNLIARCNGVKSFFPLARALYHDQPDWIGKLQAVPQAQLEQVQNLPVNQQFVELATLAGLQDWAAARGVPQDKANQCLRDENEVNKLVQLSSDVSTHFPDFPGTPSFVLNGTMLKETATWEKLKPQLDEALQ